MMAATAVQNFEQRYLLYQNISLYCRIAMAVFLGIAIVLFFLLKIPQVFGELTGRTARKAVQEMTEKNPESGRLRRTETSAAHRKKKHAHAEKKDGKEPQEQDRKRSYHDLIGENDTPVRLVNHDDIPTPAIIHPQKKNAAEDALQTTVLLQEDICETVVLSQTDQTETTLLQPADMDTVSTGELPRQTEKFKVLRSIVEIHTDEVI